MRSSPRLAALAGTLSLLLCSCAPASTFSPSPVPKANVTSLLEATPVEYYPLADGSIPDSDLLNSAEYIELPGGTPEDWRYRTAVGRYACWEDFMVNTADGWRFSEFHLPY